MVQVTALLAAGSSLTATLLDTAMMLLAQLTCRLQEHMGMARDRSMGSAHICSQHISGNMSQNLFQPGLAVETVDTVQVRMQLHYGY